MAVRQVSIRVALTGYDEYKATVTKLNQQNELLKQELKLIDAEYKNTGNASEYTRQRAEALTKQYDIHVQKLNAIREAIKSGEADRKKYEQQMTASEEKLKKATKALEDAKNSGTASKEELKKLTDAQAEANKEYTEAKAKYEAAEKGLHNLHVAENKEKIALEETKTAIRENNKALDETPPKVERVVDVMAEMMLAEKVADAIGKVKDALWSCIDASMEYEQAFANVTKTVNGSADDFAMLDRNIRDMASRLPQSAEEIAQVASTAGQLGIATQDISNFTEVMLGLGVATDTTANDAATLMAQFQNVTKFDPSKIANIASVIVDLGNNSATTESNIMNMAQRMSAAGANIGLTAQDILGMAAALTSVGIRAEAGGSSISTMFNRIDSAVLAGGDDLEAYAQIAGVTAEKFAKSWEDEPIEAIQMFITGLSSGTKSASQMLNELGFNEIRLRNSLLSLANGEDILRKSVQRANKAFESTLALDTEVGRFLDTTKNKSDVLKNNVELLKIAVGETLRPAIENIIQTGTGWIKQITEFIEKNPELIQTITVIATAIGAVTGAIVAYKSAVALANVVTAVFGTTLAATPTGMIIAGVLGLASAIGVFIASLNEVEPEIEATRLLGYDLRTEVGQLKDNFNETYQSIYDTADAAEEYLKKLDELDRKGKLTNDEQAEYNQLIADLQTLIPELNIEIDKKTGKIKGGTEAIRDQIKAWKDAARVEAYHEQMVELLKMEADLQKEQKQLTEENTRLNDEYNKKNETKNALLDEQRRLTSEMRGAELRDYIELKKEYNDNARVIRGLNDDLKDLGTQIASNEVGLHENAEEWSRLRGEIDDTEKAYEDAKNGVFSDPIDLTNVVKSMENSIVNGILDSIAPAKRAAAKLAKEVMHAAQNSLNNLTYKATIRVTSNSAALQFTPQPFAKGGIIKSPTVALMGEAGTEAVLPIEKLEPMITNAMAMYEHSKERDADFRALKARNSVREEPSVNIVEEFKKALSQMKVELDDTEMGAFVDKTVTKAVYAI